MSKLVEDRLQVQAPAEKLELLKRLRAQKVELDKQIARNAPPRPRPWHDKARPEQRIPADNEYSTHLFLAGRGWGKSATGSNWVVEQAARNPDTEWAVVAPTWRACRKSCIEGETGILRAMLPGELEGTNLSDLTVRLSNGSRIYGYTADKPDRIRGANLSGAWVDELASMPKVDDMWNEALIPALRIGENPQVVITTTPRPTALLKKLLARDDGTVRVVRGTTFDNAANLSKRALDRYRAEYEGTRLGRQELYGELLEDVEGALWSQSLIDSTRVLEAPDLPRIVVGIDPATTSGERSDSTGIIVAGRSADGHLYILDDFTCKTTPNQAMNKAITAFHKWHADKIVGEVNNGGDYLETVLRTIDETIPYKTVRATRGKYTRAQPVASLWEQGRAHMVGLWPALEDEMTAFTESGAAGSGHDDRLDAMVYSATELQVGQSAMVYLSAISKMCNKCDTPNSRKAMLCRGCGAALPAEVA